MEETAVMRNIFSRLPTEKVKIIKQDLSIIDGVDALVQSTMVFIQDGSINIEEGDTIERLLPSGAKEQFLVVDRGFYKGMRGIPDHYQITVERQSTYTKISRGQVINQYNISNADKVNIHSTDNSTTYKISANELSIMETVRALSKGLENETEIIAAVDQMQDNVGKHGFAEKYNAFIQSVANHMTIFAPFIPALSALLTK